MPSDLYTGLTWLPRADADFREQCRAVLNSETADGRAISALATHALDENNLRRLAGVIAKFRSDGRSLAPLTPFKLGVVGNGTLEPLIPAFTASAARHGVALDCLSGAFGQVAQEAFSPDSRINRERPDAVLVALDYRGLPLQVGVCTEEEAQDRVDRAVAFLNEIRAGFRKNSGCLCIVQTLAPPPESLFGNFDRRVPGTPLELVARFNNRLVDELKNSHDVLLDVAHLAATVGLENWHSPTQWNIAKFAFAAEMLPLYAEHVTRLVAAVRGKSRKCLVLDLDNTVWGGVIGDDGVEGIVLGQGDATGEAHLELQRYALALRERGIVLGVSSKNDDDVARIPFRCHPEMLLREDHIAVFQANWQDKGTNISAIAKELSIGTDAIAFLDDNPVERGLVRSFLPAVAVPEVPENPALFARTISAAGYFEATAFSQEDRERAEFYSRNARRTALQRSVGDLEAYLESLQMRIVFSPFDATGRSRITQLVNKSNQFNLTTRRYTETEIAEFESAGRVFTLQVRLTDAFGDNGMISVIVCREVLEKTWEIDTWLMSCRVLGRRVEHMVLREIMHHAKNNGIHRLIGVYIPTEKNSMVKDHYKRLGFALVDEEPSGRTTWEVSVNAEVSEAAMVVERLGFDMVPAQ